MMFRVAVNPDLAIPLSRYFDHFSMLADAERSFEFIHLLNYEQLFRAHAARNFSDLKIWLVKYEEAYLEFLSVGQPPQS